VAEDESPGAFRAYLVVFHGAVGLQDVHIRHVHVQACSLPVMVLLLPLGLLEWEAEARLWTTLMRQVRVQSIHSCPIHPALPQAGG